MSKGIKLKNSVDLKTLAINSRYKLEKGININNYDGYPIIIWVDYNLRIECSNWISNENYYTTLIGLYNLIKDGYVEEFEEN